MSFKYCVNVSEVLFCYRYLRQVIDESLRCSVSGVWGARFQEIDIKLGGYDIPKNVSILYYSKVT